MSGDATREVFLNQFTQMNEQIKARGAKVVGHDSDGTGFTYVNGELMGSDFMRVYGDMTSVGYARGWL